MLEKYARHNSYKENINNFNKLDPHLLALSKLKYQYSPAWWQGLSSKTPGIYTLTGGRQVGKSTSCKLWIAACLKQKIFEANNILYLPCDEIYEAGELSRIVRFFLEQTQTKPFLLIIDEITFVKNWDRVIKSLADEGWFANGLCLLTGSDTLILKEAAMSFPGRRGGANEVDFHLYPLSFTQYVILVNKNKKTPSLEELQKLFDNYLQCGGYLRAINDFAVHGEVTQASYLTYEQWIRGDFLKRGKNEEYLLLVLSALLTVGVSQISYSALTQKIGLISKETCMDYCRLLERMDILINLQAFDQNKKLGFPRKARKFHFNDPFIQRTIVNWLKREGYIHETQFEEALVEASVASHCHREAKTFYFKGQGEVDVIWLPKGKVEALEVKWSNQIRPNDMKTLKQFKHAKLLSKHPRTGCVESIEVEPVYQFLFKS